MRFDRSVDFLGSTIIKLLAFDDLKSHKTQNASNTITVVPIHVKNIPPYIKRAVVLISNA